MKPKINFIEIESQASDVNEVYNVGKAQVNACMYRGARYKEKDNVTSWDWVEKRYYYITRSSLLRCQRAQIKLMER